MTSREHHWRIHDQDVTVRIEESSGRGTFHISGQSVSFRRLDPDYIEISGKRYRFYVARNRDSYSVWLNGHTYHLERAGKERLAQTAVSSSTGEITALMPGKILRLEVAVGDTVSEKQTVAIMESMKMETSLYAPKSGRVAEVRCQPGQIVELGEVLMVIE